MLYTGLVCGIFVARFSGTEKKGPMSNPLRIALKHGLEHLVHRRPEGKQRVVGPRGVRAGIQTTMKAERSMFDLLLEMEQQYGDAALSPFRFTIMGKPVYVVRHPRHISRVFKDSETFPKTQLFMRAFSTTLGHSLVTVAAKEEWRKMRKRTVKHFTPTLLQTYGEVFADVLERRTIPALREKARAGDSISVIDEMMHMAEIAAFVSFLGITVEEVPVEVYLALNRVMLYVRTRTFGFLYPPLWVPTAANRVVQRDLEKVHGYLRPRIQNDAAKDTMFGDILRSHTRADGQLDTLKALQEMTSMLVGGSETSILLMAWALWFIVRMPAVEDKILRELQQVVGTRKVTGADLKSLTYLDAVVSEVLRMRPPAFATGRIVARDTDFDGFAVEKDALVLTPIYITHHDPRLWKEPHSFRPERFLKETAERKSTPDEMTFYPFGGGQYFCLGNQYSINEAKMLLAWFLQRFRFSELTPGALADVGMDSALTVRPDRPIVLQVKTREPAAEQTSAL